MIAHVISIVALCIVLAGCASLLLFQAMTGVPSMSANGAEVADIIALLKEASLPKGAVIYELGCGWGAILAALGQAFPDADIRGIEISPLPYLVSRLRTLRLPNVSVRRANMFSCDISDADAVTCYLMINSMPRVAAHFDAALPEGTAVVTLTFWFRDRKPVAVREGPGLRGSVALYRWTARPAGATS